MTGHRSVAPSLRLRRLLGVAPVGILLGLAAAQVGVAPALALPRDDLSAVCNENPGAVSLTVSDPNTGTKYLYYCGSGEMMECLGGDCSPCGPGDCTQPGEIIEIDTECPEGWIRDAPGTRCIPPEEQECPVDESYDPIHQQCVPVPEDPSDGGEDEPGSPGMSCGPNAKPVWDGETREWVCEDLGLGPCELCEQQMEECIADIEGDRQLCLRTGRAWARHLCSPRGGVPGEQWDGSPLESAWIECDDFPFEKELGGRGKPVNCKSAVIDVCVMGHMQDHPGESVSKGGRTKHGGKFTLEVGGGPWKAGYEGSKEVTDLWERTISWDGVTGIASACTREIKTAAMEVCTEVLRECLAREDPAKECNLSSGYSSVYMTTVGGGAKSSATLGKGLMKRAEPKTKTPPKLEGRVSKPELRKPKKRP